MKLSMPLASSPSNAIVAVVELVNAGGVGSTMVVVGPVVSTVQVTISGGPALPTGSVANTVNRCFPSATPENVISFPPICSSGLSSSWQVNVLFGSLGETVKCADVRLVSDGGADVTVTIGPVV